MQDLGRVLVVLGAIVVVAGLVLLFAPRIPWLGRLPGDFVLRRGPVTVYVPLATGLVVSIVLTILLNLFFRR
jgi:dipeptide/tripeptide permease